MVLLARSLPAIPSENTLPTSQTNLGQSPDLDNMNSKKRVVIFGAGGHAKVCIEILVSCGYAIEAVIGRAGDSESLLGYTVQRDISHKEIRDIDCEVFVAVGSNKDRRRIVSELKKLNLKLATAISENANISPTASIGSGSVVMGGATVNSDVKIGESCIINTNCSIDHDTVIGDFTHVGPGSTLTGSIEVGKLVFIGAGSVIIPNMQIGEGALIGAGALVVSEIPEKAKAFGSPARVIELINEDY